MQDFPYVATHLSLDLLENDPIDIGFPFGQLSQLFLDGVLLLQEIVLLLQVRYPLFQESDLMVFERCFIIDPEQPLCITSEFPWSTDCEIACGCDGCKALDDQKTQPD